MPGPEQQGITNSQEFIKDFSEIVAEANRRQQVSEDFFEYAKEHSEKREYEERRINDKQAMSDMVDMYQPYAEGDPDLTFIMDYFKDLSAFDVTGESEVWKEGSYYEDLFQEVQKYVAKQAEFQEKQSEKMRKEFKHKDGTWMTDEEIAQNPKLKARYDELNRSISESEDKMMIGQSFTQYLDIQKSGRLVIEPDEDAYFVDATNQTFYAGNTEDVARSGGKNTPVNETAEATKNIDLSKYPLFSHEPSPNDVQQGALGDCFFVSQLSNMARLYPDKIKEALRENPDGKTVTVRLFSKDEAGEFKPVYVTVDKAVNRSKNGDTIGAENCLWVNCFERALAASGLWSSYQQRDLSKSTAQNNAYKPVGPEIAQKSKEIADKVAKGEMSKEELEKLAVDYPSLVKNGQFTPWPNFDSITGGAAGPVAEMLYGKGLESTMYNMPDPPKNHTVGKLEYSAKDLELFELIAEAEEKGCNVSVGSKEDDPSKEFANKYLAGHAYSVFGARKDPETGRIFVKLRNPHGSSSTTATITTFNEDGTRSYEKKDVKNAVFEVELHDLEENFGSMYINGADRIKRGTTHYINTNSFTLEDNYPLNNADDALHFAMKLACDSMYLAADKVAPNQENRVTGYKSLGGKDEYVNILANNATVKHLKALGNGSTASQNFIDGSKKLIAGFYDSMKKSIDECYKDNPHPSQTDVYKAMAKAGKDSTATLMNVMTTDPNCIEAFDTLGESFMRIEGQCNGYIDKIKGNKPLFEQKYDESFDKIKAELDEKMADPNPCNIRLSASKRGLASLIEGDVLLTGLYVNEDGIKTAKYMVVGADGKPMPEEKEAMFSELWSKSAQAVPYDVNQPDRFVDKKPVFAEKKESERLPDGRIDYKTFKQYSTLLTDAYNGLTKNNRRFSRNSREYNELKNELRNARKDLVKMNGKPIEGLKEIMNKLSGKMFAYEKHCLENPKSGPIRQGRLNALDSLKKAAVCANKAEPNPIEAEVSGDSYIDYSKDALAMRTDRDVLSFKENQAKKDIIKGFEKGNKNEILKNASFLILAEKAKKSLIDPDLIKSVTDPKFLKNCLSVMSPITEKALMESNLTFDKNIDAAKLGKALDNNFQKKINQLNKSKELDGIFKEAMAKLDGKTIEKQVQKAGPDLQKEKQQQAMGMAM